MSSGLEGSQLREQRFDVVWQRLSHSRQIFGLQTTANSE
jgi:hypothetical protein